MKKIIFLSLFVTLSNCVSIPNTKFCTVKGTLSNGAICAETETDITSEMTLDEFILFLEADSKTNKASAVCVSADDYNKLKTALEIACRKLGKRCKYDE